MKAQADRLLSAIPPAMKDAASAAAEAISDAADVLVATHIDADGISAAAVAGAAVERMGGNNRTMFFKKLRRSVPWLFVLSILVNVGMWLERFVIIVTSLAKDFDPYAWGTYRPTMVEVGITIGSFGLFFTFFFLFLKLLPVLSITELKERVR